MIRLILLAVVTGLLAGCGGGGNGSAGSSATPPATVASLTVSGTASEGTLITGKTVKLKDANGKSATDTVTDATTGTYSIDVTSLTVPFIVTVTGTNGTYISLAQSAGTANINPITTTVVTLAAGNTDAPALFTGLTPVQVNAINANYAAKVALVATSLQAALPSGVKVEDYFKGAITAGKDMDAVFDTYQITVDSSGVKIKTKDASAATVLTIPISIVVANTDQPLPVFVAPIPTPTGTVVDMTAFKNVFYGKVADAKYSFTLAGTDNKGRLFESTFTTVAKGTKTLTRGQETQDVTYTETLTTLKLLGGDETSNVSNMYFKTSDETLFLTASGSTQYVASTTNPPLPNSVKVGDFGAFSNLKLNSLISLDTKETTWRLDPGVNGSSLLIFTTNVTSLGTGVNTEIHTYALDAKGVPVRFAVHVITRYLATVLTDLTMSGPSI